MTTALVKRAQELGISTVVEHGNLTEPQVAFFLEQFQGCPEVDIKAFFWTVEHYGLNPYGVAQIYGIPRNTRVKGDDGKGSTSKRLTIQVGINGLVAIAQRTGRYAGMTEPEWCDESGRWQRFWNVAQFVEGKDQWGKPVKTLEITPPAACRVGVAIRGQSTPSWFVANWYESADFDNQGEPRNLWKTKPALMLAKVAQAGALRRTFQDDFESLRAEFTVRDDRPLARVDDLYPSIQADRPRLVLGDVVPEEDEEMAGSDSAPTNEAPKPEPQPARQRPTPPAPEPKRGGKDPDGSQSFWTYARSKGLSPTEVAQQFGTSTTLAWLQADSSRTWEDALALLQTLLSEASVDPEDADPRFSLPDEGAQGVLTPVSGGHS